MQINFTPACNGQIHVEDRDHFVKTVERAMRWDNQFTTAAIVVDVRNDDGWLEYGISVNTNDTNTQTLFIAAIQRHPEADSEFCS